MLLESEVDLALSHERALSFLDSNFISLDASGDSLPDISAEIAAQHATLQRELDESSLELEAFISDSLEKARGLLATAKETALARYALTDDISALKDELVTVASHNSLGSDNSTLLEDVEALHEKLDQLEHARTYVRIVQHGVQLSEAASTEFKAPSSGSSTYADSSLRGYVALHDYVVSVSEACGTVEDTSSPDELSIVTFLYGLRSRTWKEIKHVLFSRLLAAAERLKWPMKIDYESYPTAERKDFEHTFTNLLKLQAFGKRVHRSGNSEGEDPDGKPGLYPLQALVQPIAARFKFHFEGTRPTNRLDKPEWFFTHILNIIHEQKPFVERYIQPLISATQYSTINAVHEFTFLLLPILSRKLKRIVPTLLSHPSLLAHTIYQTLVFDGSLRDEGFNLDSTSGSQDGHKKKHAGHASGWDGLSEVILGRSDWFDTWIEGENKFADTVFNDIISTGEAWQLVDDGIQNDTDAAAVELRPTISARRVKALIEQITDRYQHLPHLAHRLQFLLTIQLPIIHSYQSRISSSLDAYENLSSSFMRAVPGALAGQTGHGVDRAKLTSGAEGLGRLFKAFVSASWIKEAMESWGEDLVFLELWSEINEKPALRERVAAHPSLPSTESWDAAQGTIFDEMIRQYSALSGRADDMMVRQVYSEVEGDLKSWITTFWDQEDERDDTALPSTLLKPIAGLASSLSFLAASLPSAQLTTAYKRIIGHIVGYMHQRLIYHRSKGRFTTEAGARFKMQCSVWIQTCERALNSGRASKVRRPEIAWIKLQDVATLLSVQEDEIGKVAGVVFNEGGDADYAKLGEELGLNGTLSMTEAMDVLRARTDVRW